MGYLISIQQEYLANVFRGYTDEMATGAYQAGRSMESAYGMLKGMVADPKESHIELYLKAQPQVFFDFVGALLSKMQDSLIADSVSPFAEVKFIEPNTSLTFVKPTGIQRAANHYVRTAQDSSARTFQMDNEITHAEMQNYAMATTLRHGDGSGMALMTLIRAGLLGSHNRVVDIIYTLLDASKTQSNRNPATMITMATGYDEQAMLDLCSTISKHAGTSRLMIVGCDDFIRNLRNTHAWTDATGVTTAGVIALTDLEEVKNMGYVGMWHGYKVVRINTKFTNASGTEITVNPQECFVIPESTDKPIKIGIEKNLNAASAFAIDNWGLKVAIQRKMGGALMADHNHIGIAKDLTINGYQF